VSLWQILKWSLPTRAILHTSIMPSMLLIARYRDVFRKGEGRGKEKRRRERKTERQIEKKENEKGKIKFF
jgi:hypothetical protein